MKRIVLLTALALGIAIAPAAMAQSDLGFKNVGLALGVVSPEDLDASLSFGGFVDWGTITPRIGLESRIDYWSWSESEFGAEAKVNDVTIGTRGKYFFETSNPRLLPFAGAGLALHLIHMEVSVPVPPGYPSMTASDSETKLGIDLGGGIITPINPRTDFLGEVWYGIVSDVSQFSLRAGVAFKVGP